MDYTLRPVVKADLPSLVDLDMGFSSDETYKVLREVHDDCLTYHLMPEPLTPPFSINYDWNWPDAEGFLDHIEQGSVLGAFSSNTEGVRCLGLIELAMADEGNAVQVVSLYVHRPQRGHGMGSDLLRAGMLWAREQDVRALLVTTQVMNVPAIRFYRKHGFVICGLHDHYYSNHDLENNEAALFLACEL